ncbi:phosphatidylinositol-3-phosphatase SAC1-like [Anopheles aquasalis]|uniref:phosphatidylinositol-3-phosphatase SAC1-like n=1 Tax=Anopheles aquasalis TaxID=42839 RepID=UPI00215AA9BE|nr:phosphatidylinositol-3-phosphatase SAC1-like [Anopheles aquasalis]
MPRVYNELVLHLTKERILIESSDSDYEVNEQLTIDRESGEVTHLGKPFPDHPIWECETRRVCGLLGIIPLPSGPYLLVATDRVPVGTLFEKKIFRLGAVELIPIASDKRDRKQDNYCRQTVLNLLKEPYFYFSYEYHLTHSMQRIGELSRCIFAAHDSYSMYGDADQRFVWNDALLRDWYRPEMRNFCLPLMHGFISIDTLDPVLYPRLRDHRSLVLALISRRSRERAGTRLFTRGIDTDGHVANFVESEQIFVCGELCFSYVQTRGSIPLFWTQAPNLRFRPRPRLEPDADHLNACRQHLTDQCARYGKVLLVDLVDRSVEAECDLSLQYGTIVWQVGNPDVVYARKGMFEQVDDSNDLNGYVARLVFPIKIILCNRKQDRVIRANSIDCIDRTNVFQSRVAARVCARSLFELGIARDVNDPLVAIVKHRCEIAWIENANVLSRQYTGSNALKTDLTFRRSNSLVGYLRDAINSHERYHLNNYYDGSRQDAIDFFLRASLIPGQRSRAPHMPQLEYRTLEVGLGDEE